MELLKCLREKIMAIWLEDVKIKQKRKNKILFSQDSYLLQELTELLQQQNRQVVILWALELAEEIVNQLLEKYPEETRGLEALQLSRLWAQGKIKMPEAKQGILACHKVAKEIESPALYHAIGQGCSVVHTLGHTIGLPIYELTAIVRKHGIDSCRDYVEHRNKEYINKLHYWKNHYQDEEREWAKFLK